MSDSQQNQAPQQQSSSLQYMSPYMRHDFLAQETPVTIVPKFDFGRVHFIDNSFGPFSTNKEIVVPLWLALFLRETNTCAIRTPGDMSVEALTRIIDFEAEHDSTFYPLPLHFFSVVRQILRYAAPDVPDAPVVHRLVDDLEQRRAGKMNKHMNALQINYEEGFPPHAFSAGALTTTELLMLKSSLFRVINDGAELRARGEQRAVMIHRGAGSSSSSSSSSSSYSGTTPSSSSSSFRTTNMTTTSSASAAAATAAGGGGGGRSSYNNSNNSNSSSSNQPQDQMHVANNSLNLTDSQIFGGGSALDFDSSQQNQNQNQNQNQSRRTLRR